MPQRHAMRSEIWKLAWFILLESGFIALATVCRAHPSHIILPQSVTSHETVFQSFFTICLIFWQTIALFPVLGILTSIFSSEWSHLHRVKSSLIPGKTDRVSVLTSGLLNQLFHALFSSTASLSFRVAVFVLLMAAALHNLAPGAISVLPIQVNLPVTLPIGNFSGALLDTTSSFDFISSVTTLEQSDNHTYGFVTTPENCAVGWPSLDYLQNGTSVEYPSDAMCWSYDCRWEAPQYMNDTTWTIPTSNVTWSSDTDPSAAPVRTQLYQAHFS
jgi:hypothetical protein